MKVSQLRRTAPSARTPCRRLLGGRFASAVAFPATVLTLAAAALLVAGAFAGAAAVAPTTPPTLIAGWVAAVGVVLALPLAVVRGAVAALERIE